jgi:hydroxymethylpyrimidine/phosphomethylpyrimidine kinase
MDSAVSDGGLICAGMQRMSARARTHAAHAAPLVLDPVMVSTSGSLLLTHDSIAALVESLLPLCTVLTPNLPEARQLLRHARSSTSTAQASSSTATPDDPLSTLRSLIDAARELCALGPAATLVKGGHHVMRRAQIEEGLRELGVSLAPGFAASEGPAHAGPFAPASALTGAEVSHGSLALEGAPAAGLTLVRTDGQPWSDVLRRWYATGAQSAKDDPDAVVVDVLYETAHEQPRYTLFIKPHIDSSATHGTGCTLSSAIATYLAAGLSVREATGLGIAYVQASLARGLPDLGSGPGPLNHASNVCSRGVLAPSALGSATDRVPFCARLIANSLRDWQGYTQHEFVRQIASRMLPREAFVWFLKQDYIFLRHYARVWARGAASAVVGRTFADIALFAGMAGAMANEAQTHVRLCERWGISLQELELGTRESAATLAYTRYVLDVANGGDALDLLAATAPCVLGYAEVGLWLASQRSAPKQASEDEAAYEEWVETYAGDEFQEVVRKSIGEQLHPQQLCALAHTSDSAESMEQRAAADTLSPMRVARLQQIWNA